MIKQTFEFANSRMCTIIRYSIMILGLGGLACLARLQTCFEVPASLVLYGNDWAWGKFSTLM